MRKIIFMFLMAGSLHAFNNPSAPLYIGEGFFIPESAWASIRLGYEGQFVTNARMSDVDSFKVDSNSGLVTLNIKNRLDLFGSLGTARIRADWRVEDSFNVEMDSKYRFFKGFGARAVLFDWGKASLGVGGSWVSCKPALLRLVKNGALVNEGGKAKYHGWQANCALSYKADFLIPYVGIKYSSMKGQVSTRGEAIAKDGSPIMRTKNRKKVGCIVGSAITKGKFFALNLEGCLIDEESFSVTGEFRF